MSGFRVNSQELRSKASQLEQLNSNFQKKVQDLSNSEQNLATMYEGDAQKAFHNAFTNDQQQFLNFYNGIAKYVQALISAADQYERAEAKNVTTATTRK